MKIIIAFALVAVASALSPDEPIPILHQEQEVGFDGSYKYSYETGNGIHLEEHGVLENAGSKDAEVETVAGSFSYKAPDGTPIQISYTANADGYVPHGDHLPQAPVDDKTPPPIPPLILRSLEWNAAHPEKEVPVLTHH